MAVRHGYGKIAGTDALVFAYDTGDTVNSYKGEPTVNITPNHYLDWGTLSGTKTLNAIEDSDGVLEGMKLTGTANTQVRTEFTAALPSSETQYTFSVEGKRGSTPYIGLLTYLRPYPSPWLVYNVDTGQLSGGGTIAHGVEPVKNGWYRIWMTVTIRPDQINNIFKVVQTNSQTSATAGNIGGFVYYAKAQLEVKPHLTQFTEGTRSTTEGLKDLTGNSVINISNVSFDSNAQITFDGTDDAMENIQVQSSSAMTWEAVAYPEDLSSNVFYNEFNPRISLRYYQINLYHTKPNRLGDVGFTYSFQTGSYYHIAVTYDTDNGYKGYVNGEEQTRTITNNGAAGKPEFMSTRIGRSAGSEGYFEGDIPVAKIYNRALTAGEVKNNYSHYKNRFGI